MTNAVAEREQKELEVQNKSENTRQRKIYVPRTDIYESDDNIVLHTDMPGADEKSIDITLENNVLTINGSVEPPEHSGYTQVISEYGVGDYRRSFTLSNSIDKEKIEASFKNGVLTLQLPKNKSSLPKKINVKVQ